MIKRHLLALILISLSTLAFPQSLQWMNELSIAHVYLGESKITHIGADPYGNIIVAGDFKKGSSTTLDQGIFLAKYDSLGNNIWFDTIRAKKTYVSGMVVVGNSIYLTCKWFVGRYLTINFDGFSFYKPDFTPYTFLVKYDLNGNAQWVKKDENAQYYDLVSYDDKLYMTGHADTTTIGGHPFPYYTYFLAQYDTLGNCNWVKDLPYLQPTNLSASGADDIYITLGTGFDPDHYLQKFNSTGSQQWSKLIDGLELWDMENGPDGGCFVSGVKGGISNFGSSTVLPDADGWCRYIALVDSAGNYISAVSPPDPSVGEVVYYTGENLYSSGPFDTVGSNGCIGLQLGEFSGSSLNWTSELLAYRTSCITTHGSNIYIAGDGLGTGGAARHAFVARLSKNTLSTTTASPFVFPAESFIIYPNPSQGNVTLSFSSKKNETLYLSIYNAAGKCIHRQTIPAANGNQEKTVDLSGYSPGTYSIELSGKSGRQVKTLVVN